MTIDGLSDLSFVYRTAEAIARFIEPLLMLREESIDDSPDWVIGLTSKMANNFARADRRKPRDLEAKIHMANSGRIYLEQLHLHPVRLGLTFTQEWMDLVGGSDTVMIFQFIRGMVCVLCSLFRLLFITLLFFFIYRYRCCRLFDAGFHR